MFRKSILSFLDPNRIFFQQRSEMKVLLDNVYDGKLETNDENVFQLLDISEYIFSVKFKEACLEFFKKSLSPLNCLHIRRFARNHSLKDLEEKAEIYLLQHFPQVAEQSREILSLPLDELVLILKSALLNDKREEMVWKLVKRWIDHDKEHRTQHLMSLCECTRLGIASGKLKRDASSVVE